MDFKTLLSDQSDILVHETPYNFSSYFKKNCYHLSLVETNLTKGDISRFFSTLPYADEFLDGCLYISNLAMLIKLIGVDSKWFRSPIDHASLCLETAKAIQKKSGSHFGACIIGLNKGSSQLALNIACYGSKGYEKHTVVLLTKESPSFIFQAGEVVSQTILKMLQN
jgi:hypothetical protein